MTNLVSYIQTRQSEGKITTVRDVAKKFKTTNGAILEQLVETSEVTIHFLGDKPNGNTELTVEELGSPVDLNYVYGATLTEDEEDEGSPLSFSQQEVESDRSADLLIAIEQHIDEVKPVVNRRIDYSRYATYATVEDAEYYTGHALIKVSELGKICASMGVPVGRLVKAMGGDRAKEEPRSPEWKPVMVGRTRYVAMSCREDLENL
jgi:hypothetical protein